MDDVLTRRGGNWTDAEISAAAEDYKNMLAKELAGTPYNKAEHRRALMTRVHRSEGSIEFKHGNISAVLEEIGKPWIIGYKPAPNFQRALVNAVERIIVPILNHLSDSPPPTIQVPDAESVFCGHAASCQRANVTTSPYKIGAQD